MHLLTNEQKQFVSGPSEETSDRPSVLAKIISDKLKVALKVRRFNDIITIHKQLQAAPAKFKARNFRKRIQQKHNHCMKLQGNYIKENSMKQKVKTNTEERMIQV